MFAALALGLLGLVIGVMLFFDAAARRARHDLISRLPELAAAPPGEAGLIEGRIARSVSPARRDLVAYVREQYHGRFHDSSAGSGWHMLSEGRQRLAVDTTAGVLDVVNLDYGFDRAIHEGRMRAERSPQRREQQEPSASKGSSQEGR